MICAHEFSGPTAAMASPCTIISLEWRLYSALAAASARRLAAVGDGLGEEEVVASLLLHATGLLQGRLAGAPEEVAAHDTLDGAADILRDHEAAQRLVGGRPGGVEPARQAEREPGGVEGSAAAGGGRPPLGHEGTNHGQDP